MITYVCPYRKGTSAQKLKCDKRRNSNYQKITNSITDQYVHCKWDKDTDNMVWWPPTIDICNSKIMKINLSIHSILQTDYFITHTMQLEKLLF